MSAAARLLTTACALARVPGKSLAAEGMSLAPWGVPAFIAGWYSQQDPPARPLLPGTPPSCRLTGLSVPVCAFGVTVPVCWCAYPALTPSFKESIGLARPAADSGETIKFEKEEIGEPPVRA